MIYKMKFGADDSINVGYLEALNTLGAILPEGTVEATLERTNTGMMYDGTHAYHIDSVEVFRNLRARLIDHPTKLAPVDIGGDRHRLRV